jgi:hypothetical protein
MDTMRKEFEAYVCRDMTREQRIDLMPRHCIVGEPYVDKAMQARWEDWQAAAKAEREACAAVCEDRMDAHMPPAMSPDKASAAVEALGLCADAIRRRDDASDGMVLAPIEPTKEMIEAAIKSQLEWSQPEDYPVAEVWRSMIQAIRRRGEG